MQFPRRPQGWWWRDCSYLAVATHREGGSTVISVVVVNESQSPFPLEVPDDFGHRNLGIAGDEECSILPCSISPRLDLGHGKNFALADVLLDAPFPKSVFVHLRSGKLLGQESK
jgi:hypothetical protein